MKDLAIVPADDESDSRIVVNPRGDRHGRSEEPGGGLPVCGVPARLFGDAVTHTVCPRLGWQEIGTSDEPVEQTTQTEPANKEE